MARSPFTEEWLQERLAQGHVRVGGEEKRRDTCTQTTPMTEARFQAQIRALCTRLGWHRVYHTHNSKRSEPGFPDLVLTKPGRLIFAELKREGESPTIPQRQWLDALSHSVPGVESYLWYPSDLATIVAILEGKHQEPTP